jgi:hypothetical protein
MTLIPLILVIDLTLFTYYALPTAKESRVAIYITGIIFGMTILPIIPLCLSFSVEVTFPLNTATSNSVVVLFGQTGAFMISILGSELTKQNFKKEIAMDERVESEQ